MSWFIWIIILGVLLGLFFSWLGKIESKNKSKDLDKTYDGLQKSLQELKKELAKDQHKDADKEIAIDVQRKADEVLKEFESVESKPTSSFMTEHKKRVPRKNIYKELMKESTSLRKNNIDLAINKINEAIKHASSNQVTSAKIKLANYTYDRNGINAATIILDNEIERIEDECNYEKLFDKWDWQYEGNPYPYMLNNAYAKLYKKSKNIDKYNFHTLKSSIASLIDTACIGRLCVSKLEIRDKVFYELSYGWGYDFNEDTQPNNALLRFFEENEEKFVYIDSKTNKCFNNFGAASYSSILKNKKLLGYIKDLQSFSYDDYKKQ